MGELLKHLWQEEGNYCVSFRDQYSEKWFTSVSKAKSFAKRCNDKKFDVWLSPAVFGDEERKLTGSYNKGEMVLTRRQSNVLSLRALFFDIDVGVKKAKKGEGYATQKLAFAALKKFLADHQLPKPTVVSSGYGLHVYWMLEEVLSPDQFKFAAVKLAGAFITGGGILDVKPSKNSATRLRFPGTRNFKNPDDPKDVKVLLESDPCSIEDLHIDIEAAPVAVDPRLNTSFEVPTDYVKVPADAVAKRCAAVAHIKQVKGDVPEPERYAAIQLLRHSEEGPQVIHDWITGRKSVTTAELQTKIDQLEAKDIGPTTCDTMAELFPQCKGCQFRGKITTPLQVVKALEVVADQGAPARPYPTRFGMWAIGKNGVYLDTGSDDGPEQVLNTRMYIDRIGRVDYDDSIATVSFWSLQGKKHTVEMSLKILRSPQILCEWLLSKGITGFTLGKEKLVARYLMDYADDLASNAEHDTITQQLGWGKRGQFFYGNTMYTQEGTEKVRVSQSVPKNMVKGTESVGSLDAWKEGMDILKEHDLKAMQFAVLASMASPILDILNVQGAVVSLAGPSGTGKSTAMKLALSVFGDPEAFSIAPDATINAADGYMRAANNFMIGIDEMSGKNMKTIQGLVYKAANGKAKERMTQDAALKEQHTWRLILMLTTNDPMMDQPLTVLPEAERKRVVEIPMDTILPWEVGDKLSNIFEKNYGAAGHRFIKGLVRNRDSLETLANKTKARYHKDALIPDSHRFGVWLCAAAYTAGMLATKLGLISFNVEDAVDSVLETMRHNAQMEYSPTDTIAHAVEKYINNSHGKIAILDGKVWMNCEEVARAPIAAVILKRNDHIAIPVTRFKQFLHDEAIPLSYLSVYLKKMKITSVPQLMMNRELGGGQERCIRLPYALTEEDPE